MLLMFLDPFTFVTTQPRHPDSVLINFSYNFLTGEQTHRLLKNSALHLILGGMSLQRCGNWLVLGTGFSLWAHCRRKMLHPMPL
jgi:hypothetical protein